MDTLDKQTTLKCDMLDVVNYTSCSHKLPMKSDTFRCSEVRRF